MKIRESYSHEAAKADKKDKPNWADDARRQQTSVEHQDAPNKIRQNDSPLKEETKFSSFLESSAKLQKSGHQQQDDSSDDSDGDRKDKNNAREKDSADNLASDGKAEKYGSFGGNAGGGGGAQSGFGMGAGVNQLNLSENFAARSILHIADLERLISTIRTQSGLGGRREITLQLKRSVLEGLKVKIVTDPSTRVQIEFLAANEKVRSEIEKHTPELAEILRGRGINLDSLKTTLESSGQDEEQTRKNSVETDQARAVSYLNVDQSDDNTFSSEPSTTDNKIYKA